MAESVRHIVGVQFRNLATVGGSVFGRFGFSDVLTLLLALEARVVLYRGGGAVPGGLRRRPPAAGHPHPCDHPQGGAAGGLSVPAEHRHRLPRPHLRPVPAGGGGRLCAVGARPGRAEPFEDGQGLLAGGITPEGAQTFCPGGGGALPVLGGNLRGSAQYRQEICQVLVRRGLLAMEGE